MNVPADWAPELPDLRAIVGDDVVMLAEGFYRDSGGYRQYRAQIPSPLSDRFGRLDRAAAQAGVKLEVHDGGVRSLTGKGWSGRANAVVSEINGKPLALGPCIQVIVNVKLDKWLVEAGARKLCLDFESLAPFVALAHGDKSRFIAAQGFQFERRAFGYLWIRNPVMPPSLEAWLEQAGFNQLQARPEMVWRLGQASPISVSYDPEGDSLRVDVRGLHEHQLRTVDVSLN